MSAGTQTAPAGSADEALSRIADGEVREALEELLEAARKLGLSPRARKLGREFGFKFGRQAYPLCRVNRRKGLAFHANRNDEALVIRARGDRSYGLAIGVLRRLALNESLDG